MAKLNGASFAAGSAAGLAWPLAFARKCSSTKMRIAEDRLPTCRPLSIFAIKFDTEHPCARAISRKPDQNVSLG